MRIPGLADAMGRCIPSIACVAAAGAFSVFLACSSPSPKTPTGAAASAESGSETSDTADAPGYRPMQRGEDFTIYGRVTQRTDTNGNPYFLTNSYTLLENSRNYLQNGEWRESEDLIEPFPGGAVARRGPDKAIFANDLNSEAVFDLEGSDGTRLRGGVRGIQLTDTANGRSVLLGTPKASAPGRLLPPNRILFENGFEGIQADVLLVWRHNAFGHNVILREQPLLPEGFAPDSTRLEVLTEFIDAPEADIAEHPVNPQGGGELIDHGVIQFGKFLLPRGTSYEVAGQEGQEGVTLGEWRPDPAGVPVLKRFSRSDDGTHWLVESVGWPEIEPALRTLPEQRAALPGNNTGQVAAGWRSAPLQAPGRIEPIQVAASDYTPAGLLVDFTTLSGTTTGWTFNYGETYYIDTWYTINSSGTAYFYPGSVIKYNDASGGAYMICAGPVSFPTTLQTPVFTSKHDDGLGEKVTGSTGAPVKSAYRAMYIYNNATVQNARFRWCRAGIEFNYTGTYTLKDSLFENCDTGIFNNTSANGVTLINVQKCFVTTPSAGYTIRTYGAMTDAPFCIEKQFIGLRYPIDNEPLFGAPVSTEPDPMGAVGPTNYVELINSGLRIFTKDGAQVQTAPAEAIFGTGGWVDPRIIHDDEAGRWVACAVNPAAHKLAIAISYNKNPLTNNWMTPYLVALDSAFLPDFPTLGLDRNGIYCVVKLAKTPLSDPTEWRHRIVAIKKNAGALVVPLVVDHHIELTDQTTYNKRIWQPIINYDSSIASTAYAWLVASDAPVSNEAPLRYGTLTWLANNTVQFSDRGTLDVPGTSYALEGPVTEASTAPQKPYGTNNRRIDLTAMGSRYNMAVARKIGGNTYIWTCHEIGVNSSGSGTNPTRSAVEWLKLQVSGQSLTIVDSGRIYDTASTSPYFYYRSSLMVDTAGDLLLGFSASKAAEYIGAFFYGGGWSAGSPRVHTGRIQLINAGQSYVHQFSWGHYTFTTFDSTDATYWTIQQYADHVPAVVAQPDLRWGTVIAKIKKM